MKTCEWCQSPTPCHRCETILRLLDLLPDSETTLEHGGKGEGGPRQMPPLYKHPSMQKLRQTLNQLRQHDRQAWAHTLAYYGAEWRTTREQVPSRDRNGHIRRNRAGLPLTELGPPTLKRIIHPWIGTHARDRGIKFIIDNYPAGIPDIPNLNPERERRKASA